MAKHLRCYVSLCSGAADAISIALGVALLTMALLTAGAADAISVKLAGPGMPASLASAVSSYLDLLEKHRRIAAAAARELEGMEGLGAR